LARYSFNVSSRVNSSTGKAKICPQIEASSDDTDTELTLTLTLVLILILIGKKEKKRD
jgi:hypothetical protein